MQSSTINAPCTKYMLTTDLPSLPSAHVIFQVYKEGPSSPLEGQSNLATSSIDASLRHLTDLQNLLDAGKLGSRIIAVFDLTPEKHATKSGSHLLPPPPPKLNKQEIKIVREVDVFCKKLFPGIGHNQFSLCVRKAPDKMLYQVFLPGVGDPIVSPLR